MQEKNINKDFLNLLLMLSSAAWQHLGKMPNAVNGKTEPNLEMARAMIDIIAMFKEKTLGNLSDEEEQFLTTNLADLQLNYADEVNKKMN
jgi:hypothetical protein